MRVIEIYTTCTICGGTGPYHNDGKGCENCHNTGDTKAVTSNKPLISALKEFNAAVEKLATAWIESGADLGKDYPFQGSLDAQAVRQWVKTSVSSLTAAGHEKV